VSVDGDKGRVPDGAAPGRLHVRPDADRITFFSSQMGMPNFTGDIAKDFACVAQLGDLGCGFEHQFASVLRAAGAGPDQPAANQGFLRPSAYLAIVLVTNEDDCSAPPDPTCSIPRRRLVSDPWGPWPPSLNEFGTCAPGQKPRRTPAVLTDCTWRRTAAC